MHEWLSEYYKSNNIEFACQFFFLSFWLCLADFGVELCRDQQMSSLGKTEPSETKEEGKKIHNETRKYINIWAIADGMYMHSCMLYRCVLYVLHN